MKNEKILNPAFNDVNAYGGHLNAIKYVGKTSEEIRRCAPNNLDEWKTYYFQNVKSQTDLDEVGRLLFQRVAKSQVSERECIDYVYDVVFRRNFQGYQNELKVFLPLRDYLAREIEISGDKLDRSYSVDGFIRCRNCLIGIQIKPESWREKDAPYMKDNHSRFSQQYTGKVFMVFYRKFPFSILNLEVVKDIEDEIIRLESEAF